MLASIADRVKTLVNLPGLAGHETPVAAYMKKEFENMGMEVKTDVFGNCMALSRGTDAEAPVIMVFAHMDSLGYLVRTIEPDGFIRIERLGGISEKAMPSAQVWVQARDGKCYEGVIGVKAHHITPPEEKYKAEKYTEMFIDIGARSREEVRALGINVGSPIIHRPKYVPLQGTRVLGSFLDNRTGCAAVLEVAERMAKTPHKSNIWFVGTVQEEYNLRGAMMAARTVHPKYAIGLDGGFAADTPDLKGRAETRLGGGPVIYHYNFHGRGTLNGLIAHPGLKKYLEASAEEQGIKLQNLAMIGALTDGAYLQLEEEGVQCVDAGIPRRYSHSPCEVCDLKDIETLVNWIIGALSGDFSQIPLCR